MKKNAIVLILLLSFFGKSYTQEYFDCTFGQSQHELGQKLIQENDTTLVLFGWSAAHSFYFVKCNLSGDEILTKTYDFDYFNPGTDIIQLPDNEYVLIGRSGGVIRINANGEVLWNKNYQSSLSSGILYNDTSILLSGSKLVFSHIDTIPDGGIDSIFMNDIFMTQVGFNGEKINEFLFSFSEDDNEHSNHIKKTDNEDIVITGYSYNNGMPNLFLVRLDSDFNTILDTVYDHDGIYIGEEIYENTENQLIITGYKYNLIKKRKEILISNIDSFGNITWEQKIDLWEGSDEMYCSGIGKSIIESESGNLYILGVLSDGTNGSEQVRDLFLLKLNNNGDTIYTKILDNPGNKAVGSLTKINENKFAIFGASDYLTNGGYDMYLILTDSLGYFDITTSIFDIDVHSYEANFVYPNPAFNTLYFDLQNIQSIEIIDLQGKLQKRTNEKVNKLWVGDISSGLYVVRVKMPNKTLTKKIIIR